MKMMAIVLGRALPAVAVLAACGIAGLFGLELARTQAQGEIYRERLGELSTNYAGLVDRYNVAVRQSAVTELLVERGADNGGLTLAVIVRDAMGERKRIETPYDPSGEIYVDFVVIEGRVWIRRVFDANTRPSDAVIIDPAVADVQWSMDGSGYGKAVYRSLGEGRWAVSVTGSGALSLSPVDGEGEIALVAPPTLTPMEEIEAQAEAKAESIGWRDVLGRLLGG